ncbi:MotA/TolQ/ExbB proton channel family protein [Fontisphaera persica]|uniref:MotA/TolQ/ExbB proton channel family protein n=1 Tax=Fontisphaera persica TaxID=2974023 RepID=UPI0024BF6FCF|nr:MotA/TolQ/ExbB proton channel family protein [Fontisphaera persica]WCJ59814.1 MotA/TolQ/ExbB proton channel family protein [Fontisphaera persica]
MNYKRYKVLQSGGAMLLFLLVLTVAAVAQTPQSSTGGTNGLFELFNEHLPPGARWRLEYQGSGIRRGGIAGSRVSTNYLYLRRSDSPITMEGLSIPIRENPGPGEYRYLSFAWIKWGEGQVGLQFHVQPDGTAGGSTNFIYFAGQGDLTNGKALRIAMDAGSSWFRATRDLWKDFGEFTITGVSFIAMGGRDAGFDNLYLAQKESDFKNAPPIIPSQVVMPEPLPQDAGEHQAAMAEEETSKGVGANVDIDWGEQIKRGGAWMYPLYLLGLLAVVIAVQRLLTVREDRLAPRALREAVRAHLASRDYEAALRDCDQHPSTLAEALRFVLLHRGAGLEVASQSAGDIAARDIRGHLSRIYPLSVIASLAPLLGLLGTVIGMIQAFGMVALYGDEGGASMLSNSISLALITTAAGLIIAAPSIAIYSILKNRIINLASIIEVEIENATTEIFLGGNKPGGAKDTQ